MGGIESERGNKNPILLLGGVVGTKGALCGFFLEGIFFVKEWRKKGKNIQLLLPAPSTLLPFTDKSTLLKSDINLLLFPSLFPLPLNLTTGHGIRERDREGGVVGRWQIREGAPSFDPAARLQKSPRFYFFKSGFVSLLLSKNN